MNAAFAPRRFLGTDSATETLSHECQAPDIFLPDPGAHDSPAAARTWRDPAQSDYAWHVLSLNDRSRNVFVRYDLVPNESEMRAAETTAVGVIRAARAAVMNAEKIAADDVLLVNNRPENTFLEYPSPGHQNLDMVSRYVP